MILLSFAFHASTRSVTGNMGVVAFGYPVLANIIRCFLMKITLKLAPFQPVPVFCFIPYFLLISSQFFTIIAKPEIVIIGTTSIAIGTAFETI
jgi:hypothetical protein